MEEALMKLIVTVPAAAAVIVMAWMFLRAQRNQHETHDKLTKEITERSTKCHEECTEAIKENRVAFTENTVVLTKLATLIETKMEGSPQ